MSRICGESLEASSKEMVYGAVARIHNAPSSRCGMNSAPMKGIRNKDATKIERRTTIEMVRFRRHAAEQYAVAAADGLEEGKLRLLDSAAQQIGAQHGQQDQRADDGSDQRERHGVRHRLEQASRRSGQRVDGEIPGDDHGHARRRWAAPRRGRRRGSRRSDRTFRRAAAPVRERHSPP